MTRPFRPVTYLVFFILPIIIAQIVYSYDEVQVGKIVPLVSKKSNIEVLRVGPDQEIWGLDRDKNAIQQVALDGTVKRTVSAGKKTDALFKLPVDFVFSAGGQMLVSDPGLKRIAMIKVDDKKPALVSSFLVDNPGAIAISPGLIIANGNIKLKAVQIFSQEGILLHPLFAPADHEFESLSALCFSKDGTLWVLDGDAGKLHRFSSERKWLGLTEGLKAAHGLDVDEFGTAYVTLSEGRWKEINNEGKVTGTFGTKGKNPGQMVNPFGPALFSADTFWVSEPANNRLQLFRVINGAKKERLVPAPVTRVNVREVGRIALAPALLAVHDNGNLLIVDHKRRVQSVDSQGKVLLTWDKSSKKKPGVIDPGAIVLGPNEEIWMTDRAEHNIKLLTHEGEIKKTVGKKGKKEGGLVSPTYLHRRKDQSFVVADKDNTRVQVLSKGGLFLFSVGGGKEKSSVKAVAGLAGNDVGIAVLDGERKSLMFFDHNGKMFFDVTNKEGAPPVWLEPVSLGMNQTGDYFVLDKGASRVRIFDPHGKYLADVSVSGDRLACGPDHGLWVVGEKESRLLKVSIIPRSIENVSVEEDGGYLKLTGDANGHAASYKVYRSSAHNAFEFVLSTPTVSLVDTRIIPGVLYRYAVAGVSDDGFEGNWSLSNSIKAPKRTDMSLISISSVSLNPVFTAAFKYYVDHPIGSVSLTNNGDRAYRNIKVIVSLKNYTDFATEKLVDIIEAGQTLPVPVSLTLNDRVLEINENTPVQADVRIAYIEDTIEKSVSQNAPLMLYSRYAISWQDKNRLASFITPKDPPIVEFSRSAIKEFMAPLKSSTVGKPLAKAALMYESLNALSITYVPDPKTPFKDAASKPDAIDYVQFPRETLRRKTGDCDDTTALLTSLLGSVGVDTALIDMPGHILLMVDTEENDPWVLGLPEERFVEFKGTYWVPIETTRLGKPFGDAWQAGMSKVKAAQEKEGLNFISVLEAHAIYPPVSILDKEDNPVAYPVEKVQATFSTLLDQLQNERTINQMEHIRTLIEKNPADQTLKLELGKIQFEGQMTKDATGTFEELLKSKDPEIQASAYNNLGNIAFLADDYKAAETHYASALLLMPKDGGILINRARCAWKLEDKPRAKKLLIEARESMPDWNEFITDFPAELLPN